MISADFEPHACRLTMFMCIMLVFDPINMTLEGVYAKAQPCGSIRSFHIDVSNIEIYHPVHNLSFRVRSQVRYYHEKMSLFDFKFVI